MKKLFLFIFACAILASCTSGSQEEPIEKSTELLTKSSQTIVEKEYAEQLFLLQHLVLDGSYFKLDLNLKEALKFGVSEKVYTKYISAINNCNLFYQKHIGDFEGVDLNEELQKMKVSSSTNKTSIPRMAIEPDDDLARLWGTFQLSPFDTYISPEGYVPTNAVYVMGGIINGYISPTPYLYTCKTIVLGIETSKSGISNRSFNEVISVPIPGVMARVSITASEYINGAYGCANQ